MLLLMPLGLEPIIYSSMGWAYPAEMTLSLVWIGVGNWLIANLKQHCICLRVFFNLGIFIKSILSIILKAPRTLEKNVIT